MLHHRIPPFEGRLRREAADAGAQVANLVLGAQDAGEQPVAGPAAQSDDQLALPGDERRGVGHHRAGSEGLKDLPLARRYAAAIRLETRSPDMPAWAKEMEAFILEDMNELAAAKIVLGGLLEHGDLKDPNERRFLERRLQELEKRVK